MHNYIRSIAYTSIAIVTSQNTNSIYGQIFRGLLKLLPGPLSVKDIVLNDRYPLYRHGMSKEAARVVTSSAVKVISELPVMLASAPPRCTPLMPPRASSCAAIISRSPPPASTYTHTTQHSAHTRAHHRAATLPDNRSATQQKGDPPCSDHRLAFQYCSTVLRMCEPDSSS